MPVTTARPPKRKATKEAVIDLTLSDDEDATQPPRTYHTAKRQRRSEAIVPVRAKEVVEISQASPFPLLRTPVTERKDSAVAIPSVVATPSAIATSPTVTIAPDPIYKQQSTPPKTVTKGSRITDFFARSNGTRKCQTPNWVPEDFNISKVETCDRSSSQDSPSLSGCKVAEVTAEPTAVPAPTPEISQSETEHAALSEASHEDIKTGSTAKENSPSASQGPQRTAATEDAVIDPQAAPCGAHDEGTQSADAGVDKGYSLTTVPRSCDTDDLARALGAEVIRNQDEAPSSAIQDLANLKLSSPDGRDVTTGLFSREIFDDAAVAKPTAVERTSTFVQTTMSDAFPAADIHVQAGIPMNHSHDVVPLPNTITSDNTSTVPEEIEMILDAPASAASSSVPEVGSTQAAQVVGLKSEPNGVPSSLTSAINDAPAIPTPAHVYLSTPGNTQDATVEESVNTQDIPYETSDPAKISVPSLSSYPSPATRYLPITSTAAGYDIRNPQAFSLKPAYWHAWEPRHYSYLATQILESFDPRPFARQYGKPVEEVEQMVSQLVTKPLYDAKEAVKRGEEAMQEIFTFSRMRGTKERAWRWGVEGKKVLEGELEGVKAGMVKLILADGSLRGLPLGQLGKSDWEYLEKTLMREDWKILLSSVVGVKTKAEDGR